MTISNLPILRNRLNVNVVKSNSFGNNFVIYDGSEETILEEAHLADFSRQVIDSSFGIGADNLLVIQRCSTDVLLAINEIHGYWENIPECNADYIFRMFEPDGQEALCCGNGLMCIANYLYEKQHIETSRIMTEIPLVKVNVMTIGALQNGSYGWVNLGIPRKLPDDMRTDNSSDHFIGEIQTINNLRIKFRNHDLQPYSSDSELVLSGYLIFTGEPHLVFLLDEEQSTIKDLSDAIFASSSGNKKAGPIFQRRFRFGTWLVDRIGQYLNKHYRDRFPAGISVNFARRNRSDGSVEYRCYERGINRETLACGTGAVAVAYVVKVIQGIEENRITILPHRCRWFKPDAQMVVTDNEDGWVLQGQPDLVAEIGFRFEQPMTKTDHIPQQHAS